MAKLQIKDIEMVFDKKAPILKNLSLTIEDGELVSILGPSGCGKTTTLRIIAGLLEQTSGTILVDDDDLTHVPVHKREFGMVFQSYALFPHLTIFDNVAFGLKEKKMPSSEIKKSVTDSLKMVGLDGFEDRYPKQLSGGQQQRVSLARALVIKPKLLLMDEPLSNLDAKLRIEMREEIRRIQQQLKMTVIFVTHDREECFAISDKVAVMNKGRIEQYASPQEIYKNPATQFVAKFIGFENFIEKENSNEVLTIRPEDIKIVEDNAESNILGEIESQIFLGQSYRYRVNTNIGILVVDETDKPVRKIGTNVQLNFPKEKTLMLK